MQLEFHICAPNNPRTAPPGELHLRPATAADDSRTDLARLALEKGMSAFVRGDGPLTRAVVRHEPSLDDLLALLFLELFPEGSALPSAHAFAAYAASLRQGVRPAPALPVEYSLEGLFATIRNNAGARLTDPATAARFLNRWERLAALLRRAVLDGADPSRTSLFADSHEFQSEREFLLVDREVYQRDVLRGQRWSLMFPGDRARASGLWLPEPRSSLFALWARSDSKAPDGIGYDFLAVSWTLGQWTFSTDPLDRRPIADLAAELQHAEAGRDPVGAQPGPWYDGWRHAGTVVGAPHGGTRLSDEEVLAIVCRWGRVRTEYTAPIPGWTLAGGWRAVGLVAVAVLGAVLTLTWFTRAGEKRAVSALDSPVARSDTKELFKQELKQPTRVVPAPELKLAAGKLDYEVEVPLTGADTALPIKLWLEFPFHRRKPLPFREVKIRLPVGAKPQTLPVDLERSGGRDTRRSTAVRGYLKAGDPRIRLQVTGQAMKDETIPVDVVWQPDLLGTMHLHVLAVGVSEYAHPKDFENLRFAHADAEDFCKACIVQRGELFDQVFVAGTLVNKNATRENIINGLAKFSRQIRDDPARLKLGAVLFSGHGGLHERWHSQSPVDREFHFFAHDYQADVPSTHIYWTDLQRQIIAAGVPVLVVLDSCHSGQAAYGLTWPGAKGGLPDRAAIQAAAEALAEQTPGLMLMAATPPDARAFEDTNLKHGLLTYALLEVLNGQARAGNDRVVSVADLEKYARCRVKELAVRQGIKQTLIPMHTPGLIPGSFPIALNPDSHRPEPQPSDAHKECLE